MDKQPLPPSYNDAVSGQYPSAPMMSGNSPQHAHAQQGWNPHMYPQLPVTAQPNTGYQRSDPAVQPLAAAQQTIVIINQTIPLRDSPVSMICQHCHQQTITKIEFESSWITHVVAGVLCMIGWCPCACIPYCTDCTKDCVHKCMKCNGYIGTYHRADNAGRRF